jgi:hypothetical protein
MDCPLRKCSRRSGEVDCGLLEMPEVARVTYLRLALDGPRMVYIIGDVDLAGDNTESHVAVGLLRSKRGSVPPPR